MKLSGATAGLTRVRSFAQDDAHIFCTEDQVADEFRGCIEMTQYVLQALKDDQDAAMGASFDYMMQTGYVFGGWHMARSALLALARIEGGDLRLIDDMRRIEAGDYVRRIVRVSEITG